MSSIHELGRSGLGPWEANCSRSERFAQRSNGNPIFREACSASACAKALSTRFDAENKTLTVALGGKCVADRVAFQLVQKAAGKNQDPKQNNLTATNVENSQAVFSYEGAQEQGFDAVRVILYQNNREVYRTNPSLDLPIPTERENSVGSFPELSGTRMATGLEPQ